MRTLRMEDFIGYAHQQIEAANRILAGHRPGGGWCSCGRPLPCSVAAHAVAARQRYADRLSMLDATAELPVLAPTVMAKRVPWWRRLLGGAR